MLKTKTIYIFIFSLICFIGAIYSFVYVRGQINTKIETVKEYRIQEANNKNIDFSTKIKKDLDQIAFQENILKNVYLDTNKLVDFISFLESEGLNNNLKVSVDKVERSGQETIAGNMKIEKVKLFVVAEGSYLSIQSFLTALNNLDKQISFSDFKLYKVSSENSFIYGLRITINALTIVYE